MQTAPLVLAQRTRITGAALEWAADAAAGRLRGLGVHRGQRVGLCADNSPEFVVALLALARIDCSIALLDPRGFTRAGDAVRVTGARHVLLPRTERSEAEAIRWWAAEPVGCPVLPSGVVVDLPPGDVDVTDLVEHEDRAHGPVGPGSGSTATEGSPGSLAELARWPWARRPDGLVQPTSGSTGTPSLVLKRPADAIANVLRTHARLHYREDDVLVPILPVGHQYGLSVLLLALVLGRRVVLGPPDRVLETLRLGLRAGATVVDTTPQAHEVILRARVSGRLGADTGGVRWWCVGGGPLTPDLQERALAVHGRMLLDGYGSTELGNVAHVDPEDPTALLPLPGVSVRVVDRAGTPLGAGEWGRLLVRTPDAGSDEHATGDVAMVTTDGHLVVGGRDGAVDRNGLLVYPAAVEHAARTAGLNAVCLPTSGQRLVLVVEDRFRRPWAHWRSVVDEQFPPTQRPDRVVVRDRFPLLPVTGKVDRARLSRFVEVLEHARSTTAAERPVGPVGPVAGVHHPERVAAIHGLLAHLRADREQVLGLMSGWSSPPAAALELAATEHALAGALAEVTLSSPPPVPRTWVHLPSNVVLYSYVLYLVVPSLFTQRLLARPSSRVNVATRRLHEHLAPVHGLPIELVDLTQSAFAAVRGTEPGTVLFTGRHPNAELVRAGLAPGQLMIYFGQGTNPVVVGPGADMDRAAQESVMMRTLNGGQDCFGPDLHLVHRGVADAFVDGVVRRFALPRSHERATEDQLVLRDVVDHVCRHREHVVAGGRVDLRRLSVEPTLLRWDIADAPACSEVFAPIFNVVVYDDESEVRSLLDSAFYRDRSMCASLYGTSEALAHWCADRMTVSLGTNIVATDDPNQAFGGVGAVANYVATVDGLRAGPLLVSEVVSQRFAAIADPASGTVTDGPPRSAPRREAGVRP